MLATWVLKYAALWYVWTETKSAESIGLLVAAEMFPTLLLSVPGGLLADGRDRFRMVRWYQAAIGTATMLIGVCISYNMGHIAVIGLYLIIGILTALLQPCAFTITTSIIEKEKLSKAVSANSLNHNLSALLAPIVAYILITHISYAAPFYAAAMGMFVYVWNMGNVTKRADYNDPMTAVRLRTAVIDIKKHLFDPPHTRVLLVILLGFGLFVRPMIEQFPKLLEIANGTADLGNIGIVSVVIGAANFLASIILSSKKADMSHSVLARLVITTSALPLLMVFSSGIYIFLIILFFVCVSFAIVRTIILFLLQADVPEHTRGRMLSVYFSVITGAAGIGSFIAGTLNEYQYYYYLAGGALSIVYMYRHFTTLQYTPTGMKEN